MIYVQLLGGIGNLCFQISTVLALGWDNDDEIVVSDTSQSVTKRDETFWLKTIFRRINTVKGIPSSIKYIYREPNFMYNKIQYIKDMQVFGYFQSPKYFDKYKDKLLEIFLEYKHQIQNYLDLTLNSISNKPTISLHIRRADYLKLQHCHIVLDETYYEKAIYKLAEKLNISFEEINEKYTFVFFSDDIPWCKKSLVFNSLNDIHFITLGNDVHELYLMSMCDHNIIANSSYSWWGSYLNEKDHITICPKHWFNSPQTGGKGPPNWSDIYCDKWLII